MSPLITILFLTGLGVTVAGILALDAVLDRLIGPRPHANCCHRACADPRYIDQTITHMEAQFRP